MKIIDIGRHPDNHIVIKNDPTVSRKHLQLVLYDDGQISANDLGSKAGVFVDGQQISELVMLKGDEIIRIGNTVIPWRTYFEIDDNQIVESEALIENTPADAIKPEVIKNAEIQYADFFSRFGAFVIDTFIISILIVFCFVVISIYINDTNFQLIILNIAAFILQILYYSLFESQTATTPGKMAFQLKVKNVNFENITFLSAMLRFLAKILSFASLTIGFLMIIWTKKKQALHDKIMNTVVIISIK